jgi:hypothetical protein
MPYYLDVWMREFDEKLLTLLATPWDFNPFQSSLEYSL